METGDINLQESDRKRTSHYNPLDPIYKVKDENNQYVTISHIDKNKSKILHQKLNKEDLAL